VTAPDDLSPELDRLAADWVRERVHQQVGSDAWYRAQDLALNRPDDAWRLTLALMQRVELTPGPATLQDEGLHISVASIPNYILERYATAFVDRMEREAARNPVFRDLLRWMSLADDVAPAPILQRLKAASGGLLQIYPAPGSELGRVAYDVGDLFRSDKLPGVPAREPFPLPLLAREIERRCPGHTAEEYDIAAVKGLFWSR
jgi:hypothetical protein